MIVTMIIMTDLTAHAPRLLEPSDFKSFKVVVRGGTDEAAAERALAPVAEWLGDDHVAVSIDAVRRLAGPEADTAEWQQGFTAMLGYAESKGWIVGEAIKAHVEWADQEGHG
jgi:hypothetical protein